MKRLVALLVLVGLIVGVTLAVRHLPWWALVLIFVGAVVGAKFAVKGLLKRLFLIPFKMKGAVLHGASAEVHSVAPSHAPTKRDDDSDSSEPEVPRRYFTLEVTIKPNAPAGKFRLWEPGELQLTKPEYHVDPNSDKSSEDDSCRVAELQYQEEGVFKTDEGLKFEGPLRLKMTLGVREGVQKLKFQYYFEEFGEVNLPSVALRAAA